MTDVFRDLDLFDCGEAVRLLESVVCDEAEFESSNDLELSDAFNAALQTLRSAPAIRAAGPTIYGIVQDWLGVDDDGFITALEPILDRLCTDMAGALDRFTTAIIDGVIVDGAPSGRDSTQSSVSMIAWTTEKYSISFINGLLFCILCLLDIYGWCKKPASTLYWHWISLLLAESFVNPSSASDNILRKLTSQPITSLVLPLKRRPAIASGEATETMDVEDLSLQVLSELIKNPFVNGGYMTLECGTELYRRVLSTLVVEFDNRSQLISRGTELIANTCATAQTISFQASGSQNGALACGIPSSKWFSQISPSLKTTAAPSIILAHMVLKTLLPFSVQYSSVATNTPKEVLSKQTVAGHLLRTFAASIPALFSGSDVLKRYFRLPPPVRGKGARRNGRLEGSEGCSDEEMEVSQASAGEEPPSASLGKAKRARDSNRDLNRDLFAEPASPWLAFICMALCMLPDRRDVRDRFVTVVVECIRDHDEFAVALIDVLMQIGSGHDRGSIRLSASELSVAVALDHPGMDIEPVINSIVLRCSDQQSTVRARAVELLGQALTELNRRQITSVHRASNVPATTITPPGSPTCSRPWCGSESGSALLTKWLPRITAILHSRILDEKSIVRKSCASLIESLFVTLEANVLKVLSPDVLEILCDDITITVRQKFSGLVSSLYCDLAWLRGSLGRPGEVDLDRGSADAVLGVLLNQMFRLSSDAEEVVCNKVLDTIESHMLAEQVEAVEARELTSINYLVVLNEELADRYMRAVGRLIERGATTGSPTTVVPALMKSLCQGIVARIADEGERREQRTIKRSGTGRRLRLRPSEQHNENESRELRENSREDSMEDSRGETKSADRTSVSARDRSWDKSRDRSGERSGERSCERSRGRERGKEAPEADDCHWMCSLLCNLAIAASSTTSGKKIIQGLSKDCLMLCLSLFESIINHNNLGNSRSLEHTRVRLELLIIFADSIDPKNRSLIYESLESVLYNYLCHPCLFPKIATLCEVLVRSIEDNSSGASAKSGRRTEDKACEFLMRLLSNSKRTLSNLSSNEPCALEHIANACVACGYVCMAAQNLNVAKLNKFIATMDKALVVTLLGLAGNNILDRTTPEWLRCICITSVSQILLSHEGLAKRFMSRLVELGIENGTINLVYGCFDLTIGMTSVMDPYLTLLTSTLSSSAGGIVSTLVSVPSLVSVSNLVPTSGLAPVTQMPPVEDYSGELRFTTLQLIAQLIAQDYIKCKGLVVHHLLFALGDPCPQVSGLALDLTQTILLPRVRDLLLVYFVETVCFMTGYYTHPKEEIKPFDSIHPLQRDVLSVAKMREVNISRFVCGRPRRMIVYASLLALSQEQSKHLLTSKCVQDFIQPLIDQGHDSLPADDESTPCGQALSDILAVLASSDMKLIFRAAPLLGTEDNDAATEASKTKYEKQLMIGYMTQTVVPVLANLYKALRHKNSALQKNVVSTLADLLAEFHSELDDIVEDKGLRRILQRKLDSTQTVDENNPQVFDPIKASRRRRLKMNLVPEDGSFSAAR
ncbi:non-SMC mitotic condensation complex subunit 1 [Gregarina niphandrodes]|uniref:Non-SMC mitotic condensation complex subunit 1 n=1 Tax=Gregarina niphandrodes TaxID=110365 RepID=A0A023BAU6_GRENI|nr:non-SMC mitotic condensation complex subunit 1 [Gregarina niphandrodes]EZG78631.1 non-SMC mitotic condensation complex subunit 1 [Gregarina niphandrodes]|eukprot:XP_011129222.1 non-SMC mitotic condensation complex subunit 1 [Gregarina niphandrodes]